MGARPDTSESLPCSAQGKESRGPGGSCRAASPSAHAGAAARNAARRSFFMSPGSLHPRMDVPDRGDVRQGRRNPVVHSTAPGERCALMWHGRTRRTKNLHGRIIEEIRHTGSVEIGVVLHLLTES